MRKKKMKLNNQIDFIDKAKTAKTSGELIEMGKEYNVELTEDIAERMLNSFKTADEMSDDDIEAVAGGKGYPVKKHVCSECGTTDFVSTARMESGEDRCLCTECWLRIYRPFDDWKLPNS